MHNKKHIKSKLALDLDLRGPFVVRHPNDSLGALEEEREHHHGGSPPADIQLPLTEVKGAGHQHHGNRCVGRVVGEALHHHPIDTK